MTFRFVDPKRAALERRVEGIRALVSRVMCFDQRTVSNQGAAPWGDGFLEESFTTAMYRRSWDDLTTDELVLFHPFVAQPDLKRRILSEIISRELDRHLSDVSGGWVGGNSSLTSDELTVSDDNEVSLNQHISVMDCLHRMLWDVDPQQGLSKRPLIDVPTISGVLVASIHSGLNGAYVYPEHAASHELFGVGAWLGILLRGRTALMPPFAADLFMDYFNSGSGLTKSIILSYAETVVGSGRLLRHAQSTLRSGQPALVRPVVRRPALRLVRHRENNAMPGSPALSRRVSNTQPRKKRMFGFISSGFERTQCSSSS